MGFMSSLVNIGSLTLQTAINKLGQDIIVAHTAARKISEIFMTMFSVFGQTMATYCGQNLGAGRIDRVKKGIRIGIFYTCIWCTLSAVASYTIGSWLVYLVTGSTNEVVILNATSYLKFDTLFYYVTAVICVLRNAMQGLGDHITPLISSSLEMARENRDRRHACADVRLHRCHCGGAARVVYHGNSTRRADLPDAGTPGRKPDESREMMRSWTITTLEMP